MGEETTDPIRTSIWPIKPISFKQQISTVKLNINQKEAETSEGCFGSTKVTRYLLSVRLEVSADELYSIKKQKLDSKSLCAFPAWNNIECNVWVEHILNKECVYVFDNLAKLQRVEREIMEGCKTLKNYVSAAEGFGGSKSVEL